MACKPVSTKTLERCDYESKVEAFRKYLCRLKQKKKNRNNEGSPLIIISSCCGRILLHLIRFYLAAKLMMHSPLSQDIILKAPIFPTQCGGFVKYHTSKYQNIIDSYHSTQKIDTRKLLVIRFRKYVHTIP